MASLNTTPIRVCPWGRTFSNW